MKKMLVFVMTFVMVATMMVTAIGENELREQVLTETKIEEKTLIETIQEETVIKEDHREPNYIVTIGGDRLIDVEVNHHPAFVKAIGNGAKWVGTKIHNGIEKVKGIFTADEDDV